jgi:SAM-dependent methyltransferase
MSGSQLFDHYAGNYEEALTDAISLSGESRGHFAEGRVAWLRRCLQELGYRPRALLDFGCGDGATSPLLLNLLQAEFVIGVDVSRKSLDVAQARHAGEQVKYEPLSEFRPSGQMELAYCNGVFHHIPPRERANALTFVSNTLRPGGLFSFWENNPWNPVMRYVMSRCAFDSDAIMLAAPEARALLAGVGFEILRTDFHFVFPRSLRALRKLEDLMRRLPIGAQYQILCRKIT